MKNIINYEESLNILNNIFLEEKIKEKLFLTNALGRILSDDIIANENSPAFITSGMDGYAIKSEDQKLNTIKIIDKNPAGSVTESKVENGSCIKTFTGSLMPEGADTLIPIENVEVVGDCIKIVQEVSKGFAVRDIGENYKENEILIKKGTLIGFAEIGVMASLNISQVSVYSQVVVSIASTGSEILDIGEVQTNKSQIRSSNHLTVEVLAKKAGAKTIQMGTIKDDMDSITQMMKTALDNSDIVVTTGGVSKGDYDFVQDVVKEKLGAEVLFHGVNIKPGGPILIAKKDNKLIISLPGFAYSSTVCAILYLLPMIYKYEGSKKELPIVKARINQNFPVKIKKTVFTACNVKYENGEYNIDFEGKKQGTSAILTNLLGSPALLIQDKDSEDIKAGDLVDILLLNELN
ncbi:molybdenum cofactor synthesis domain protein [Arcobacter nitrofigilis DSM 7299]|uniref:Molybdopterin molybdenumtransferase n=1 Tax=Arcobacter nitrofigilis (strain ATCC 33309 / DSM 7299 / CCUG 15893 / LMG 7604 / NCTC 12251 / CI) TaxID=572480 RepID=D5V1N9_ARCNC|nr:molybdopterin molybdotransferase MoeA [Arcobacter nitrofigilis]ADG93473.1 molybdenum cofactor synthesis domain protein [Arcobacter nitrofigilis DSM 7299]